MRKDRLIKIVNMNFKFLIGERVAQSGIKVGPAFVTPKWSSQPKKFYIVANMNSITKF